MSLRIFALVAALAVLPARASMAEPAWSAGVSQDQQARANALFADGNQLFAQQAHAGALEKYQAAIAIWDHPLIRFNITVTLIRLDRILEAADNLDAALRFGKEPFPQQLYPQALDYQKLLSGLVGTIEASCDQNAAITLDGKPWFSGPGNRRVRVLAGQHVILAEHPNLLTVSRRVDVRGGSTANERIMLVSLDSATQLAYPINPWLPRATLAAGIAMGLGGLGVWLAGKSQMDEFDVALAQTCTKGCAADLTDQAALRRTRDSARLKGTIGASTMAVAGAVATGAVVWLIVNRPRRVLPNVEFSPSDGAMRATVAWAF